MPPPLIGGGIKRCFCLTSVCPSVRLSRTSGKVKNREAYRKTKIGTGVAHVTRDSDTSFKVKRSEVKVTRPRYWAFTRSDRLTDRSVRLVCQTGRSDDRIV